MKILEFGRWQGRYTYITYYASENLWDVPEIVFMKGSLFSLEIVTLKEGSLDRNSIILQAAGNVENDADDSKTQIAQYQG